MRGFAFALNVRCNYCHVEKSDGKKMEIDFVADDKDTKKTARVMLQMITAISESLLAQKKNPEALAIMELNFDSNHPDSVWSCHMLALARQANGLVPEAIADYRKVLALHPDDDWARKQIASLSKAQ